jgi:hypothetical protein
MPGQAVAVLLVDGQLGPLSWAFAQAAPEARLGAIGVLGGPGAAQRDALARTLEGQGLLAGVLPAGECNGAEQPLAIADALRHALTDLGWHAAVCLPGSAGTNEGVFGLGCATAALSHGYGTLAVAEMLAAAGGPRAQLSERTLTLLDLLPEPVTVALPAGIRSPVGRELREGLRSVFDSSPRESQLALGVDRPARIARHDWRRAPVDIVGLSGAGLPAAAQMPPLLEEPLLFASALAAGNVLADMLQDEECP